MPEGEKRGEQKRRIPFIEIYIGPDYDEKEDALLKLGWTKAEGPSDFDGEVTWFWENEEDPILPEGMEARRIKYTI